MKFRTRSRARSVGVSSAIVFLLAGGVAACSSDADGDSPGGDAPGGGSEPVASDELDLSALDVSDEVAEELQSLYQEALEEGTFTSYAGHQEELAPLYAAYEEAFPGITVNPVTTIGADSLAKLEGERASGNHVADIYSSPNIETYLEFAQPYEVVAFTPPEGIEGVAPEQLVGTGENEHMYAAGQIFLIGTARNTELVEDADAPRTWADMVDPAWDGQTVFDDPSRPGGANGAVTQLLNAGIIDTQWMNDLGDGATITASQQLAGQQLSAGQAALEIFLSTSTVLAMQNTGAPVAFNFLDENNIMLTNKYMLVDNAPNPAAAKLFLNFIHTKPAQEAILESGDYPLNQATDVTSPHGFPRLDELHILELAPNSVLVPLGGQNSDMYREEFFVELD
ncbi:MAG TPA: extracellular solute-binding protein [Actinomycetaceae bacterium]|nr:extracellular solute-binding protein [Actinomycetaceae bacterium]